MSDEVAELATVVSVKSVTQAMLLAPRPFVSKRLRILDASAWSAR